MTQQELHAHLVRLADWLNAHTVHLEMDLPEDAEGFPVLPKGIAGDPMRVLQTANATLTRIIYHLNSDEE